MKKHFIFAALSILASCGGSSSGGGSDSPASADMLTVPLGEKTFLVEKEKELTADCALEDEGTFAYIATQTAPECMEAAISTVTVDGRMTHTFSDMFGDKVDITAEQDEGSAHLSINGVTHYCYKYQGAVGKAGNTTIVMVSQKELATTSDIAAGDLYMVGLGDVPCML